MRLAGVRLLWMAHGAGAYRPFLRLATKKRARSGRNDPALPPEVEQPPPLGAGEGGAETVTVTAAECVFDPSVPVTVTMTAAVEGNVVGVMLSVEEAPAVTDAGLSVAVTPLDGG